ncbi:MAG: hypothetical protein L0226_04205 [Acidobacteria bacterium]|nr:hypothetical protein [Acidobacteriota bacterium]
MTDEEFEAGVQEYFKAHAAIEEPDTYALLVEAKEVWQKEGREGLERWLREREERGAFGSRFS